MKRRKTLFAFDKTPNFSADRIRRLATALADDDNRTVRRTAGGSSSQTRHHVDDERQEGIQLRRLRYGGSVLPGGGAGGQDGERNHGYALTGGRRRLQRLCHLRVQR